jgi:hypothetical protein
MAMQQPATVELAVVGLARNCARSIERDLKVLEHATQGFGEVHFLIVESDSTDDTVALLRRLELRRATLRHISLGRLSDRYPLRTERIAHCRNAYLDAIAGDPRLATVSHVLMVDLDGVCRDLDAEALASCWRLAVPWAVCTANQGDYYYDIWALRHPVWCPGDAWREHDALVPLLGETEATNVSLFSRMVRIPRSAAPIEVDSAFGGAALYTRAAALAARYAGLDTEGREVCEHVGYHARLRAAGHRIFINPALINANQTKHGGRKKFWRTLRRRVWNALRGHD